MSRRLHISGDNGRITVIRKPGNKKTWDHGWLVTVPDDFKITLDLSNIGDAQYVYEYVLDHKDIAVDDVMHFQGGLI